MVYPKKCTDFELVTEYTKTGSIWKTAQKFGMCGQSVWERLKKLNVTELSKRRWKKEEIDLLKAEYSKKFLTGDGSFKNLSTKLNRLPSVICTKAKNLGLTDRNRKDSKNTVIKRSKYIIDWHSKNKHPQGMLGKHHSEKSRKAMSKRHTILAKKLSQEEKYARVKKGQETKIKKYGVICPPRQAEKRSWKAGWREIGEKRKYYRSSWEANYARYLEFLKENGKIHDWEHEPQTFWFEGIKRGSVSYLPDFKVYNSPSSYYWVEVKGWMDDRSRTKLKRFKKYFPNEDLILVDAKWFKKNQTLAGLIKNWE